MFYHLQIDGNYTGEPPPLEVTIFNLNDNIDKAFLLEKVSFNIFCAVTKQLSFQSYTTVANSITGFNGFIVHSNIGLYRLLCVNWVSYLKFKMTISSKILDKSLTEITAFLKLIFEHFNYESFNSKRTHTGDIF